MTTTRWTLGTRPTTGKAFELLDAVRNAIGREPVEALLGAVETVGRWAATQPPGKRNSRLLSEAHELFARLANN